jgi:hypothetical protein
LYAAAWALSCSKIHMASIGVLAYLWILNDLLEQPSVCPQIAALQRHQRHADLVSSNLVGLGLGVQIAEIGLVAQGVFKLADMHSAEFLPDDGGFQYVDAERIKKALAEGAAASA